MRNIQFKPKTVFSTIDFTNINYTVMLISFFNLKLFVTTYMSMDTSNLNPEHANACKTMLNNRLQLIMQTLDAFNLFNLKK